MPASPPDLSTPFWNVHATAYFLHTTTRTIHRLVETNPLFPRPIHLARKFLFKPEEIRAFAEACRVGGAA
jgi:hypothetical protein